MNQLRYILLRKLAWNIYCIMQVTEGKVKIIFFQHGKTYHNDSSANDMASSLSQFLLNFKSEIMKRINEQSLLYVELFCSYSVYCSQPAGIFNLVENTNVVRHFGLL